MTSTECPRCGGGIPNDLERGKYPGALSRWDNKTEICSTCGTEEALVQWCLGSQSLDPVCGAFRWVSTA